MSTPVPNLIARGLAEPEIEEHLTLMCRAFGLDQDSSTPIYYSDPFFDLDHKRVLVDASGNLLSCLTIVPAKLRLPGGAVAPVAGIAGVATRPDEQGKGHAGELLRATAEQLGSSLGFSLSALVSERPAFYERFGWECCSQAIEWSVAPSALELHPEGSLVKVLGAEKDMKLLDGIHALYERAMAQTPGTFLRDARRWRCIENLSHGRITAIVAKGENVAAYLACSERSADLFVHEMVSDSPEGRQALMGFLASQAGFKRICGRARPSDMSTYELDTIPGVQSTSAAGMMLRVTSTIEALSPIAQSGFYTPHLKNRPDGFVIRVTGERPVRLHAVRERAGKFRLAITNEDPETAPWIELSIGAFSQLYAGFRSPEELARIGRLQFSGSEALELGAALFPRYETFLGLADTF